VARYVWEVPESEYPVVAETVMRLSKAELDGDLEKVQELSDRLRSFPCYPKAMTPDDTMVIVMADPQLYVGLHGAN
jgi:hypothetical protein